MLREFSLVVFFATLLSSDAAIKAGFPPSPKPGCLPADANNTDLFCPGDLGYGCFKIPTILKTVNGTLLAMIEARKYSCADHGFIDLWLRRSIDGGKTWAEPMLMYRNSTESQWITVGDGNWVQDASTGTIWLFHTRNNSQLFLSHSADDGLSCLVRAHSQAFSPAEPDCVWNRTCRWHPALRRSRQRPACNPNLFSRSVHRLQRRQGRVLADGRSCAR
ncbi:unnamed protein product [Prorocentrum cordatum]|uniref:Sialidase domain-containing protein n=1 Tax=Prorocentrum cordatum TaxID=2364126 RepID=A0ABN9Q8D3_9DINO|nr:unnamed protein product [Polarella glacialis]